jgi:chaperonin cofactor prefoldin
MSRYWFPLAPLRLTNFYSSLVIKTLDEILPKDPKRRCFRLIGGVLVEQTVEDVAPNLKTNLEGVSRLLSRFLPHLTI